MRNSDFLFTILILFCIVGTILFFTGYRDVDTSFNILNLKVNKIINPNIIIYDSNIFNNMEFDEVSLYLLGWKKLYVGYFLLLLSFIILIMLYIANRFKYWN